MEWACRAASVRGSDLEEAQSVRARLEAEVFRSDLMNSSQIRLLFCHAVIHARIVLHPVVCHFAEGVIAHR